MIVIGRYRIYLDEAARLGGEVFNIPKGQWDTMTPDERWALNKEFLDQAMVANKTIRLATPPEKVPLGSTCKRN